MKLTTNIKIALVTLAILIVIMFISANNIWPEIQKKGLYTFKEDPLQKVALAIKPGETYTYRYDAKNYTTEVNYITLNGPGCVAITIAEIKNGQATCIKPDGTDSGGSNLSFSNPSVLFFRPWMLAVKENWEWKAEVYATIANSNPTSVFRFMEINETVYNGRSAFVVLVGENDFKNPVTMIIDKEKRILLKESGSGYVMELIKAPFLLSQQAE